MPETQWALGYPFALLLMVMVGASGPAPGASGREALRTLGAEVVPICREVFEHLTVLQVRESVRNICRISSKFAYVTTRFHPNPATLLDVTTQFDVDPSHITLLNKDMLRLMFTACHPVLATENRVALTLRTLGGLQTPEIASAFLTSICAALTSPRA